MVYQAQIPAESRQRFIDCLMDGFSEAHWTISNTNVRQHRREDCLRVESLTNASILVSVDIFDDGRVQLLEAKAAALVITRGEKKAFRVCLDRFGGDHAAGATRRL